MKPKNALPPLVAAIFKKMRETQRESPPEQTANRFVLVGERAESGKELYESKEPEAD